MSDKKCQITYDEIKEHAEAISALRQRGKEVNFAPNLPHSIYAYTRLDLVGKYYKLHTGKLKIIQDAAEFCNPHYIFDGLALKIQDYWRFGCPMEYVSGKRSS